MDRTGFVEFLKPRNLSQQQIDQHIADVERFEAFLQAAHSSAQFEQATAQDVHAFLKILRVEESVSYDTFLALARYGRFVRNNHVYLAVLELLDGHEAMEGMYHKVGKVLGEPRRNEIFKDIALPALGTPSLEKSRINQVVMQRLEASVDEETCRQIFSDSFRDLPDEYYLGDRKQFQASGGFDEFLELKRQEFVADLERIKNEGSLFFNQPITDEVIAFVKDNPEVARGVRMGNILYVTKIPYMAREYLAETDEDLKRYYYCHCPWARESLRRGEKRVSATFCNCSAGYHKKPWEVIFGQPLQADVLESVLKGDLRCRFAIHLPADVLEAGAAQAKK